MPHVTMEYSFTTATETHLSQPVISYSRRSRKRGGMRLQLRQRTFTNFLLVTLLMVISCSREKSNRCFYASAKSSSISVPISLASGPKDRQLIKRRRSLESSNRRKSPAKALITTMKYSKTSQQKHLIAAASSATRVRVRGGSANDDLSKNSILPLMRILFLTFYGMLGSLMPYLPVYYDSLGHGGMVVGMLGAVKPFTTFLVAPLWGYLSDSTGKHDFILQFCFLTSLLLQLSVYLYPQVNFLIVTTFLTALLNAPVKSLLDAMVMDVLEDKTAYGRIRLYGQLGFGAGSSGVGMLLGYTQNRGDKLPRAIQGYGLAFTVFGILSLPVLICMRQFQRYNYLKSRREETTAAKNNLPKSLKPTTTTHSMRQGINLLLHNPDVLLFFTLVFVIGLSSGAIENFAYVRMREIGGSGHHMGLSRLVSSLAGAPMFYHAGKISKIVGTEMVLVASVLSYALRFAIYATMKNPYHGLPAEALRGLTFGLFWTTGTIYAHEIAPLGMSATMLMLLNAMYGGIGQSLGAVLGGKMQSLFGTVHTFYCGFWVDLILGTFLLGRMKWKRMSIK